MTLYVSLLRLDRHAVKVLRITDIYSLHRVVYNLFDDIRPGALKQTSEPSGIQWADHGGDAACRRILVLSNRQPQGTQYGEITSHPLPEGFLNHQHYRFTVTLCPVRRDRKSRQLKPVRGREAIAGWFMARATSLWGFRVDPSGLQTGAVRVEQFRAQGGHDVTLQQVTLSGNLTVTCPELFARAVASGVGRARAFGCGLLQIVPLTGSPFYDQES